MVKAVIQFYEKDGDARLFDENITMGISLTIAHPIRKLKRRDVSRVLRQFGYDRYSQWIKADWGYEAKFSRRTR